VFPILYLMNASNPVNLWTSHEHVKDYLERADSISHRQEGEAALLEFIPPNSGRILDLGTGDGRLLALVWNRLRELPEVEAVAVDFSPAMLEAVRQRFATDSRVRVIEHNLDEPLPALGELMLSSPVSPFITLFTSGNGRCMARSTVCSIPAVCSATWSTWPRPRRGCTKSFCTGSDIRWRLRIPRTSCWMSKRNWAGCAKSDSWMWIATGSGGNWRCWWDDGREPCALRTGD